MPQIDILNSDRDWKYIFEQFQFYPVVASGQGFYAVDVWAEKFEKPQDSIFYLKNLGYSNYAMRIQTAKFREIKQIARKIVKPKFSASVQTLVFMPEDFVSYLLWKVENACKKQGIPSSQASKVELRFETDSRGQWILSLERIYQ
ncbi:MAG: hypothetical protein P1V97_08525 [Planctomycetota bacterium]|nr:hypothetical protein [Planctomycetota bacterium]